MKFQYNIDDLGHRVPTSRAREMSIGAKGSPHLATNKEPGHFIKAQGTEFFQGTK